MSTGAIDPRPVEPHHDGSPLYVEPGPHHLGDRVAIRVRVPHTHTADRVFVRTLPDGEQRLVPARADRRDDHETWWVAEIDLDTPVLSYRFLLERDTPNGLRTSWLDGAGLHTREVTDAASFRLTTHRPAPAWLAGAVGYQVFPDRFARSADWRDRPPTPDWARPADWDDPVEPRGRLAVHQLFGGDLHGVREHLDHIADLGADVLYLTPFFPARSSHRYDATTFDAVDPLLGGDGALAALCAAAHERGIRVIGDLTLNHTGDEHEWFAAARARPDAPETDFYLFGDHPTDYVAWYDVPTLPKLDHRSAELQRRLLDGPDSVVARWLRPAAGLPAPAPGAHLDGWRIDCANTSARHGEVDLNHEIARRTRATMLATHPDPWLVAEHAYDPTTDLAAGGWHGVMAYQWFTRPLVRWLGTADRLVTMSARPMSSLDGIEATDAMRALSAGAPWDTITASMTLLDSHDTPRFRNVVEGDTSAHLTAMLALATFPGVPTVFAGSEVGVAGGAMDAARVPFPWDPDDWDDELLAGTRAALALRRTSPALARGGLRWLPAEPDRIRFAREHPDERLLVELCRGAARPAPGPVGGELVLSLGAGRVWRW